MKLSQLLKPNNPYDKNKPEEEDNINDPFVLFLILLLLILSDINILK
ncbi:MAG: hypothetical protein ACQERJ_00475 [Bacillota bacterium]